MTFPTPAHEIRSTGRRVLQFSAGFAFTVQGIAVYLVLDGADAWRLYTAFSIAAFLVMAIGSQVDPERTTAHKAILIILIATLWPGFVALGLGVLSSNSAAAVVLQWAQRHGGVR